MDQQSNVLYLRMKGISLDAIHEDLVRTLERDAMTYSTVTKSARSAKFSPKKDRTSSEPSVVESSHVDDALLATLVDSPFRRYASSPDGTAFLDPLCTGI
jgi:hypothetical protein